MTKSCVFVSASGNWSGTGRLHLSWLPEDQQVVNYETSMNCQVSSCGEFVTVSYDWVGQDEPHQGVVLVNLGGDDDSCDGAWVDSWHQAGSIMALKGTVGSDGEISLLGSYSAGPGEPDWGWRIEFVASEEGGIQMLMTNILPTGEQEWAVDHRYTR